LNQPLHAALKHHLQSENSGTIWGKIS